MAASGLLTWRAQDESSLVPYRQISSNAALDFKMPIDMLQENLPAEVRAQALRAAALAAKLTAEAEARSAGTVTQLGGGIRCGTLLTSRTDQSMPAVTPGHFLAIRVARHIALADASTGEQAPAHR